MTDDIRAKNEIVPAKEKKRESFFGPNFVEHYANSCYATTSQWDIQLTFGRNDDSQDVPRDQKLVKIYLSPMHAKAVLRVLGVMVQTYEEKFGELKVPTEPPTEPTNPATKP